MMPTLEKFVNAWEVYFPGYGNTIAVRTNWGNLCRDTLYSKLKEVSNGFNSNDLYHYNAWIRHLYLNL